MSGLISRLLGDCQASHGLAMSGLIARLLGNCQAIHELAVSGVISMLAGDCQVIHELAVSGLIAKPLTKQCLEQCWQQDCSRDKGTMAGPRQITQARNMWILHYGVW